MKINKSTYIFLGLVLTGLGAGSIFSLDLVRYGYFILIGVFLVVFYALSGNLDHKKDKKSTLYSSLLGLFLFSGFLGMQSPQIPFKTIILVAGLVLIVMGLLAKGSLFNN